MNLIPRPASLTPGAGTFALTAAARILVDPEPNALPAAGRTLAGQIWTATGHALPVLEAEAPPLPGDLVLTMAGADPALGKQGYDLVVTRVHGLSTADRDRRDRLVAGGGTELGGVVRAAGRPWPAAGGDGGSVLPVAGGTVAVRGKGGSLFHARQSSGGMQRSR